MNGMASAAALWFERYQALVRTAWLVDFQYRAAIGLWLLWGVLEPVISLGIWWSVAGDGSVQGFDRADFAQYFFAVILINQLTLAWDAFYIDSWIRSGELNYRLARPLAPIHEAVADNIAYKIRSTVIVVAAWLVIAAFWPPVRMPFDAGRWTLAAVATLLAAAIRFLNGYATGLLAFWTTRASALVSLQMGVALFLSGRIAPLTLLPPAVVSVASFLWFPYMLAFPVELLTNADMTANAILRGFTGQLVWTVAWAGICTVVWKYGVRRYAAVGG